jgi:hypothetical protein
MQPRTVVESERPGPEQIGARALTTVIALGVAQKGSRPWAARAALKALVSSAAIAR